MWQKLFFLNAITFLFFNRIQNGFHRPEGLIFLDLMKFKKNKVQKCCSSSSRMEKPSAFCHDHRASSRWVLFGRRRQKVNIRVRILGSIERIWYLVGSIHPIIPLVPWCNRRSGSRISNNNYFVSSWCCSTQRSQQQKCNLITPSIQSYNNS